MAKTARIHEPLCSLPCDCPAGCCRCVALAADRAAAYAEGFTAGRGAATPGSDA